MFKLNPLFLDKLSRRCLNTGDVPTPPAVADESFIRPIISILIIVIIFARSTVGCSVKCRAPWSPFSSASNPISKMLRFNLLLYAVSFWANSRSPAIPDALSSAPGWTAFSFGFLDPEPSPPIPMWSKWAPTTIYSSRYFLLPLLITPMTFAALASIKLRLTTDSMMVLGSSKVMDSKDWFIVSWIICRDQPTVLKISSARSLDKWIAGIPAFL